MDSERLLKWLFGIIDAAIALAVVCAVTILIGYAVTGSWDVREWKTGEETAAVAEYVPEYS